MRSVEVDLIACGAADCRRENRQPPVEIAGPAKCSGGNQHSFAFPERGDQNREVSVLRQQSHEQTIATKAEPSRDHFMHADMNSHGHPDYGSLHARRATRDRYQTRAAGSTRAIAALVPSPLRRDSRRETP